MTPQHLADEVAVRIRQISDLLNNAKKSDTNAVLTKMETIVGEDAMTQAIATAISNQINEK